MKVSDLGLTENEGGICAATNYLSRATARRLGARIVPRGSIIFPKVGAALLGNARALTRVECLIDNNLMAVTPMDGDPRFWLYVLTAIDLGEWSGGGPLPYVSEGQIRGLRVWMPEQEEQRRIADFLDAETSRMDRLATMRTQQLKLLDLKYQNSISELVTPGISGNSRRSALWPWLPEHLSIARLGYFARIQNGVMINSSNQPSPSDIEVPYLRVANVQDGRIDLSEIKTIRVQRNIAAKSMLLAGDVLMTEANGNPDNLGRGAIWRGEVPHMIHQNHVFAIRVHRGKLNPDFLSLLLASIHGRKYFRHTSNQVGIATTSSSKVLAMPVLVTGIREQAEISRAAANLAKSLESTQTSINRQLDLLNDRRQALITAAVTGQLDVTTARSGV